LFIVLLILAGAGTGAYFFNLIPLAPLTLPDAVDVPQNVTAETPEQYKKDPKLVPVKAPSGFSTKVSEDAQTIPAYYRQPKLSFGGAQSYTGMQGITAFRGNHYRSLSGYGAANIENKKLRILWEKRTGFFGSWAERFGSEQPLIVTWPEKILKTMDMYPQKRDKKNLTEVIYPCEDGKIYFLDLADGKPTRDPIDLGTTLSGAAALDPRGYPLLYVGDGAGEKVYMHIISLIDSTELCRMDTGSDEFSGNKGQALSSGPLVSGQSDTLLWAGGNGLLYTVNLNTDYSPGASTIDMDPSSVVRYQYDVPARGQGTPGNAGVVSSPVIFREHLFFVDQNGWLECVNLNTMELEYSMDLTDETVSSLVLEEDVDNGTFYLYTASLVKDQKREIADMGISFIRKIDGCTGRVVWEQKINCLYRKGLVSGAVATPLLGQANLKGMIFFTVAQTKENAGTLIALSTSSGSKLWSWDMGAYSWSTPAVVYSSDGEGYIVQCDSAGNMYLLDGASGEEKSKVYLGAGMDAAPAVYQNTVIIGTEGKRIFGVRAE